MPQFKEALVEFPSGKGLSQKVLWKDIPEPSHKSVNTQRRGPRKKTEQEEYWKLFRQMVLRQEVEPHFKSSGLTEGQIAQKAGVDKSVINRVRTGKIFPSERLVEVLGLVLSLDDDEIDLIHLAVGRIPARYKFDIEGGGKAAKEWVCLNKSRVDRGHDYLLAALDIVKRYANFFPDYLEMQANLKQGITHDVNAA